MNAEETLRYFIRHIQSDKTTLEAMALETAWTTRFYIYYAVSFFLRATLTSYTHICPILLTFEYRRPVKK